MAAVQNPGPTGATGATGPGITTQTSKYATRAIDGTVYHNTLPTTIWVSVSAFSASGIAISKLLAVSDSSATPTVSVAAASTPIVTGNYSVTLFFPVLPGNYYYVTAIGAALTKDIWMEYS